MDSALRAMRPLQSTTSVKTRQRRAALAMGLRGELKRKLRKLIKPWKTSTSKPPFTAEQLVVIALFLCPPEGSTQARVERFIMQHFGYYLKLALACTPLADSKHLTAPRSNQRKVEAFQKDCNRVYRQFEVPIQTASSSEGSTARWTITAAATHIFLRDVLRPSAPEEPFPFQRLPAELRNRIYEYVLRFPTQGVCVKVKAEKPGKESKSIPAQFSVIRDQKLEMNGSGASDFYYKLESAYRDYPLANHPDGLPKGIQNCLPAADHLSVLSVSKQVFQEAMPIFYSTNNFTFDSLQHLLWFLEATPAARRDHIEHVSFYYMDGYEKFASPAFKLLKEISHLRELDIGVAESYWKNLVKVDWTPKYPDVLKVPGAFTLRSIRGLKVVRFHGDCETFKTLIPEMTGEKKKAKAPRKRKAKADADNAEPAEDAKNGENVQKQIAPAKKKARKGKST
ncbi:hypothetical protein M409DRAFT_60546 [Zasmidium cellare ATCC 36951]|uniref:DUF7730 domain-containing protein n=1 Tax=Zasmidium cellare ATCC 36951 TaxID=1080233 RepID=A0A6A6BYA0_ZASCE|nr:uncharacterized protein M409DRAFT_60546 [Zasmidium cellare ATCC 36951]KAF2159777.1 hypothetical protein M409DRAFT_60546 [Zasmidium cellare ATCC 36951]